MSGNADISKKEALEASTDMTPVQGAVDVDIPASVLWEAFTHADWWPRWNKCMFWAKNRDLVPGRQLIWCFQPIKWWHLYKMPAIAKLVEVEKEKKVTWEVTALPGFYARHTYSVEDLGDGRSRFGSWEQAMGFQARFWPAKKFWTTHFTFVKDRSLEGARELEEIYKREGEITKDKLKPRRYRLFWLAMVLLALLVVAGIAGYWFYSSFLKPGHYQLAPGVHLVTAGGGNSLVVEDGSDVMLVDTKFPPASDWLKKWLDKNIDKPVTMVVNTHYHYDHTLGNPNYPQAKIYAYKTVPDLMNTYDKAWWGEHPGGYPKAENLVDAEKTLKVGAQDVVLTFPGNAHTHGDLWVYLKRGDREFVATGDLVMNGYYPFMDLSSGGVDVPGLIETVREMAAKYPNAVFIPGHGNPMSAADVNRFADYLETLNTSVAQARTGGLSEDQAVKNIDLGKWGLHWLPSYHQGKLCVSTAENNIRWVYQIQGGNPTPWPNCAF
jgi:glyoxylase-like metal-dependent hydrolase (beta-lactamase superfamily II)